MGGIWVRVIFCKIGWMKEYRGIWEEDNISFNGRLRAKNHDCMEQFNFIQKNEYCYGCVPVNYNDEEYGELHIEYLEDAGAGEEKADSVLLVWVSPGPDEGDEIKIVGWYKNAVVFRHRQNNGLAVFDTYARASDCILLPLEKREFIVNCFHEKDIWFSKDFDNRKILEDALDYISSYDSGRLNTVIDSCDLERVPEVELYPVDDNAEMVGKLYDEGKYLEALKFCNAALKQGIGDADIYNLKGLILYELYQYDEALKCYKKSLTLYPEFYEIYYNRALIYEEMKDYEKALEDYDIYLEYCPMSPDVYLNKGQILIMTGDFAGAERCFDRLIDMDPANVDAYAFRAIILWNAGNLKEALKSIDKALDLCPYDEDKSNIKSAIIEELSRN